MEAATSVSLLRNPQWFAGNGDCYLGLCKDEGSCWVDAGTRFMSLAAQTKLKAQLILFTPSEASQGSIEC